jgi:peptidoglycan/xylan/chitin deacetylase (PgdA/CDA1 family)
MSKRKILIGIFGSIIVAISLWVNVIRQNYVVPIIMYHSVNPDAHPENRLSVTPKTFQRQMYFLKKHRYNVLPLESLIDLIKDKKKFPPKTIFITFDDGYRDIYLYAFPILKKYNLPATIFIITNEVGRAQNDRLTWEEIKAMRDSGIISIGSHSLGPEPLTNLKSEEVIKKEIFDSKKILEEKLGHQINFFSYPEGRFNAKIRQYVIDAGYKLAVATHPGRDYPDDDLFALKRLRISENARNLFVFMVETSGYYTWMKESKRKRK